MIEPSPSPAAPSITPDMLAEDALYYRQVLHGLIAISADVARMAHLEAQDIEVEPKSLAEAVAIDAANAAGRAVSRLERCAAVVERSGRCVRRSIGLARTLSEPVQARRIPADDCARAAAVKRDVIRSVEDAIHTKATRAGVERAESDRLRAELYERAERPELAEDVSRKPAAEIITEICRDLGLRGDYWLRRRPDDLASLSERAKGRAPNSTWWPKKRDDDPGEFGPRVAAQAGLGRGPGQSPGGA